jgi:hypothetical protein
MITLILPSSYIITLNDQDNVSIQPDDNICLISQPDNTQHVKDNVIIQPDDNVYVIFRPDDDKKCLGQYYHPAS